MKYKLIKEYPGSKSLGTIVEYYSNWGFYGKNQICEYRKDEIENYPEFWEKLKPVLFTTRDEVEVCEDTPVWYVCREYRVHYSKASANFHDGTKTYFVYFSTKESAEQYVYMNKPCLSLNDVLSAFEVPLNGFYIQILEKTIKENESRTTP